MAGEIVCIGGVLTDELFFASEPVLGGTSNPARLVKTAGGVVCNIAMHLAAMNLPVKMITVLGNDADADWLEKRLQIKGIDTSSIIRVDDNTGKYAAILDHDGSLYSAVCHDITEEYLTADLLKKFTSDIQHAKAVVADTNISETTLGWVIEQCFLHQVPLFVEPVSVAKGKRLSRIALKGVFMITPNLDELKSISADGSSTSQLSASDLFQRGVAHIWLRKGKAGSSLISQGTSKEFAAAEINVKDSTGAGDAALAGFIKAWCTGWPMEQAIQAGHALAYEVLQHTGAVMEELTESQFLNIYSKYYNDEIVLAGNQ